LEESGTLRKLNQEAKKEYVALNNVAYKYMNVRVKGLDAFGNNLRQTEYDRTSL
jgi:hypothetical protein